MTQTVNSSFRSGYHFNGNLPCAIDLETTGLNPVKNEIIQIAIVPLTMQWEPDKSRTWFHTKLKPKRPHNFDDAASQITKVSLEDANKYGIDPDSACDRFDDWFQKLMLAPRKQIIPVGINYLNFDALFITEWLGGPLNYRHYFRSDVRDAQLAALHHNDRAEWRSENVPFSKVNLRWMCDVLGVRLEEHHDALADAIAGAECYRRLLKL